MKKIVVTLFMAVVLAAAGTVQAATVLKKDNLTFKISGDWQLQLRQDVGNDQDLDLEYDDLEIKNYVSWDLKNGAAAFGQLDFGFKNAADDSNGDADPHLEEAYVGFEWSHLKLYFGKTSSAGDEFGIAGYKETVVEDDAFDAFGAVDGDDLIAVAAKIEMVSIVATYEISADSEKSDDNGEFIDLFVSFDVDDFSFGGAIQSFDDGNDDIFIWGLQASFDAKFAKFAVDYSSADDAGDIWNFFVAIPVKPVTFGLGIQGLDPENGDAILGWYANVIYKFPAASNVRLFAEIGDSDEEDVDMGYLVGMRIRF